MEKQPITSATLPLPVNNSYLASGNSCWPVTSLDDQEGILGAVQCRCKVRDSCWVSACCRKAHCSVSWKPVLMHPLGLVEAFGEG